MKKYKIDYQKPTGNAIKIEVSEENPFNTHVYYTTIEHLINLLELEEYQKYLLRTEYEEETNNDK